MKLSIIIPAYNAEQYIEKCIVSCENQDLDRSEYEIIVVDDGSTDGTAAVVESMSMKYENIQYIYQENARQGAARNNGLRNAKGKYIWYVDADDWIADNCIGEIIRRLESNSLTALLVGHVKYINGNTIKWDSFNNTEIVSGAELLTQNRFYVSPTYAVWLRKYLLNERLFFIEKIFHEDTEIVPRLYLNAGKIGFYDKECYFVYTSDSSTTRSVNPQRAFDLIKVVDSMKSFAENVQDKRIYTLIMNNASVALNVSFLNSYNMKESEKRTLSTEWARNKNLFWVLLKSGILKYRIEGLLFMCFPKSCLKTYLLIQLFNKKPGGGKSIGY